MHIALLIAPEEDRECGRGGRMYVAKMPCEREKSIVRVTAVVSNQLEKMYSLTTSVSENGQRICT